MKGSLGSTGGEVGYSDMAHGGALYWLNFKNAREKRKLSCVFILVGWNQPIDIRASIIAIKILFY